MTGSLSFLSGGGVQLIPRCFFYAQVFNSENQSFKSNPINMQIVMLDRMHIYPSFYISADVYISFMLNINHQSLIINQPI